ncbi:hypothetical protein DMH20_03180 [Escherichia coli]|nr:hypothetical protein [Escherichia coli]
MPPTLKRFLSQSMQRKVNRSDSDYHYDKEKYKWNVVIMMRRCKNILRKRRGQSLIALYLLPVMT